MSRLTHSAVHAYVSGLSHVPHPVLTRVLDEGRAAGVPVVDPQTGALLHTLVRTMGATTVLEIGTAIGYSTLWMATAMPPTGLLVTLERDATRAVTARANLREAGVDDRVNVIVGDAERYLHKVAGPFDLIFQDGDKALYEPLLDRLITLLRPGGVLVTDNVLWDGDVVPGFSDTATNSPSDTAAIAAYNRRLAVDTRVVTTWFTIGDGAAVAVRT